MFCGAADLATAVPLKYKNRKFLDLGQDKNSFPTLSRRSHHGTIFNFFKKGTKLFQSMMSANFLSRDTVSARRGGKWHSLIGLSALTNQESKAETRVGRAYQFGYHTSYLQRSEELQLSTEQQNRKKVCLIFSKVHQLWHISGQNVDSL